jgi:hypothetical protein
MSIGDSTRPAAILVVEWAFEKCFAEKLVLQRLASDDALKLTHTIFQLPAYAECPVKSQGSSRGDLASRTSLMGTLPSARFKVDGDACREVRMGHHVLRVDLCHQGGTVE